MRLHARIKEHPSPLGIYSNPRSRTTELSLVRQLRLHFHARSASVWTTRIIQQAFGCPLSFSRWSILESPSFLCATFGLLLLILSTHWLALLHYPPFSQIFRVPLRLHHNNNNIINCMLLCLLSLRFPGPCLSSSLPPSPYHKTSRYYREFESLCLATGYHQRIIILIPGRIKIKKKLKKKKKDDWRAHRQNTHTSHQHQHRICQSPTRLTLNSSPFRLL